MLSLCLIWCWWMESICSWQSNLFVIDQTRHPGINNLQAVQHFKLINCEAGPSLAPILSPIGTNNIKVKFQEIGKRSHIFPVQCNGSSGCGWIVVTRTTLYYYIAVGKMVESNFWLILIEENHLLRKFIQKYLYVYVRRNMMQTLQQRCSRNCVQKRSLWIQNDTVSVHLSIGTKIIFHRICFD